MKLCVQLLAVTAPFAVAAVPHLFLSGRPAVAQDVNENFASLDTAIQNRATKSDVAAKVDSVSVLKLLKGKADTSSVLEIGAKADTGAVRKAIGDSISALRSATIPSNGGNLAATGSLSFQGGSIQYYPDNTASALYGDNAGTPGPANYSYAWMRDGSAAYLRSNTKYFGVRASDNAPIYNDGTTERTVWHSGNLDPSTFLVYGDNLGQGAFDNLNPPIGSWGFDCNCGSDISATAPSSSANIQVFSTGTSVRGFQIAAPYDAESYFLRRGKDTWQPWVQIVHSGNIAQFALAPSGGTITGDLRISGKLVTNPGATPADYVFEPDYQLASLSEVEAYTKVNKHLPEVPSAADMNAKGVDLAAMNMALLKKVEELTLHAIAQQKEMAAQKIRLEALESKMSGR